MYVRQKKNKSGVISVQVIDKSRGKYEVVKTIGSSQDPQEIIQLVNEGKIYISKYMGQIDLNFEVLQEKALFNLFFSGIKELRLLGPELLLGKIFDEIGFNKIKDELFRILVISRLSHPVSKLKTTDYIFKHKGEVIDVERIYRYMDKLHKKQKELVQDISYAHSVKVLNASIQVVFYDVTTLYFEIETPDELRKTGFSKEGRHQNPQILLGLLVSKEGYPLAYQIFEGDKYEGHTMLPVIKGFTERYKLEKLVVVADSGLLNQANIEQLEEAGYEYILGARIKNTKQVVQEKILSNRPAHGQCLEIFIDKKVRLIYSYSDKRAYRDQQNRDKGLRKLEKSLNNGKLSKKHINNRGYNKYLTMEGDLTITIDYDKYTQDSKWDGLKGYITNTALAKEEVIEQYGELWKIEKAFRISKSDLRIRPIFHRLQHRIEAHICISFCAYKIYKELERQLKAKKLNWSPEQVIDITNSIFSITVEMPYSKTWETKLHLPNKEQRDLWEAFGLKF
jgi:transposase